MTIGLPGDPNTTATQVTERPTLQAAVRQFLEYPRPGRQLAENTLAAYQNDLRQFLEYLEGLPATPYEEAGPAAWKDLHRDHILGFVLSLKDRHGYVSATVARKVAAVKGLCRFLHRQGMVEADPAEDIDLSGVNKPLPRTASVEDVALLLESASQGSGHERLRDEAMLRLLYSTGLRVSELVSLNVEDVDPARLTVRCQGSRDRQREVPVDQTALVALEQYLASGRPRLARHLESGSALFLNHRGQRLTRQGFWLILKGLAREAQIGAPLTPHMLRHSFAAHQVRNGVELGRLKELLGHASLSTTQVYVHLQDGKLGVTTPRSAVIAAS